MQFKKSIAIGDLLVSDDAPVFIIAEAGVNHGGDIALAKKLIDVAVEAKANAVKFQAFKSENLILATVKKAPYQQKTTGKRESQLAMLKKLELTAKQNRELKKYCQSRDIIFITTAFDEESLDELDELDLPAYKISSTDTTNIPLLEKFARKQKPLILSTGMTYFPEVTKALEAVYPINQNVILLQCTGNYPFVDTEANLRVIQTYKREFDMLVGYSDHSVGIGASPYAVALGAKVVEKHFTLDKRLPGPDHKASIAPDELVAYVQTIRKVEDYLGSDSKMPTISELATRKSLQKCLVAAKSITQGEPFTRDNLVAKRTGGTGISPIYFYHILGKIALKDFVKDDIIEV